jgi:flagellin
VPITLADTTTCALLTLLSRASTAQSDTLTRMSTSHKINAGKDNPAGLIALKALDAEYTAATAAIDNNQRTNAMLSKGDADLKEVSDLLGSIETLVAGSVGDQISDSEKAANQAQIDSAVDSIDRIIRTSKFNGKSLLNGQLGIRATGDSTVDDIRVFTRDPQLAASTLDVRVLTASKPATSSCDSVIPGPFQVILGSTWGSARVEFSASDDLAAEVAKVNAVSAQTGILASATPTSGIFLRTIDTGADQFISVEVASSIFDGTDDYVHNGADAVVTVNGSTAAADGNKISFNNNGMSGSFTLTDTGDADNATSTITIDGGGATFQLGADSTTRATIGISSMFSHNLGKTGTGFLSELKSGGEQELLGTGTKQLSIVKEAINVVAEARGRVGGFQKYQVQTSINSLQATQKSLADAKGVIDDVDYAQETAELNRQNILLQSTLSLLGLANQRSSEVLRLLR